MTATRRQNSRATSHRYYWRNRENGLCGHCARPANGKSRCQRCLEKRNQQRAKERGKLIAKRIRGSWCINLKCSNKRLPCEQYCREHMHAPECDGSCGQERCN